MPTYLQLGDRSDNLLREAGLRDFAGVVLSPVNYTPQDVETKVLPTAREQGIEMVLDPQLYNPRSPRRNLQAWDYFPTDFGTADEGDLGWWETINDGLAISAEHVGATIVCSPASLPRAYDDKFYAFGNLVYRQLRDRLGTRRMRAYRTILVDQNDVGRPHRAEHVASIVQQEEPSGAYIVIVSGHEPRRELSDVQGLAGTMRLIRLLEDVGIPVIVSHAGSEHVLWKAASASVCATGKFLNTRRFATKRFGKRQKGGRQLSYWFEEGLMAYLQEGDLARLLRYKPEVLGIGASNNPFAEQILEQLEESPGKAWLRLGWLQYLAWFMATESYLDNAGVDRVDTILEFAEGQWLGLAKENLHLMEDAQNDGTWIREWRIALDEFERSLSQS